MSRQTSGCFASFCGYVPVGCLAWLCIHGPFFTSTLHYMNHVPNMGPKFFRAPGRRPSCPRPEPALPAVASTVASCSWSSGGVLAVIFSLWCIYGVVEGWNLGRRPRTFDGSGLCGHEDDSVIGSRDGDGLSRPMAVRDVPSIFRSVSIQLIRCCAWRLLADAPSHVAGRCYARQLTRRCQVMPAAGWCYAWSILWRCQVMPGDVRSKVVRQ
jgi:hypothetical protein